MDVSFSSVYCFREIHPCCVLSTIKCTVLFSLNTTGYLLHKTDSSSTIALIVFIYFTHFYMSPRSVLFSVCFCTLASVKCSPSIYYNDNCSKNGNADTVCFVSLLE
jgi:hypothetical protein